MYAGILFPVYFLFAFTQSGPTVSTAQIKVHDINNVEMSISNFGKIGQTQAQGAGCWWPKGSGHNYMFGSGMWFGTIVDEDTLVTIGYECHGAATEFVPGLLGQGQSDPGVVLYMYPVNWPPPLDIFPMAPQEPFSHQDSWCCYNDGDSTAHVPGDTRPIGLEVYQTGFAWDYPALEDVFLVKFEIKNTTDDTLKDCYVGFVTDNDIGNEAGTGNDIIGCILGQRYCIKNDTLWIDDIGSQWQEEIEPGSPPWWPGIIAFDFLQTPWDLVPGADKDSDGIDDQYERDSTYFVMYLPREKWDVDGDLLRDWRDPSEIPQCGMTAFKRFTLNLEPNRDSERYLTLAGYNFKSGQYEPYDSIPPQPDDQRFLMGSGPFALPPDSAVTVMVAIMFADWMTNYERPDTALVLLDYIVQYICDMNWLLPFAPPPPDLTCIPGDARITLLWDTTPETEPDRFYQMVGDTSSPFYDPLYREYDFEGYRIFRKRVDVPDTWTLLGQCDLYNDIEFAYEKWNGEIIYAENTGLIHSYTDSTVRNGFPYAYTVTSFDFNQWVALGGDTDIILESQRIEKIAIPCREPANYIPGSFIITSLFGNPALAGNNVSVRITRPLAMTDQNFHVHFGPILYDNGLPGYSVFLKNAPGITIDSIYLALEQGAHVPHEFSSYQGLSVTTLLQRDSIPNTQSIFDSIRVITGTYPESLLVPNPMPTNWAYRGNDYQVTWKRMSPGGGVNTVDVIDGMTGDAIPYKPYFNPITDDSLADGWCFQSATGARDTIVYGNAGTGTRYLYVCGGRFSFARGWLDIEPRPSDGEMWYVSANADFPPAPANAQVQITPTPARIRTDTTFTLNVKVVPNPYVMYNEWDRGHFPHRIRFINLPSACTIRIFTLAGEFVRAIIHNHQIEEDGSITDYGGDEWWDMLNLYRQRVCAGVYIFHVRSEVGEQVGKFVVLR